MIMPPRVFGKADVLFMPYSDPSRAAAVLVDSRGREDDDGRAMLSRGVALPSGAREEEEEEEEEEEDTAVAGRALVLVFFCCFRDKISNWRVCGDAATSRVKEAVDGRGGRIVPAPRRMAGGREGRRSREEAERRRRGGGGGGGGGHGRGRPRLGLGVLLRFP